MNRLRSVVVGLLAAAALGPLSPLSPAAPASAATTLAPQARPAFITSVPPASTVLRPYGRSLTIYAKPKGRVLIKLNNPLLAGVPLVLAEYGGRRVAGGWIPVALPVRPNNTIGWVRSVNVKQYSDPWRVDIYRSQHKLVVWNGSRVFGVFPVAVGKPSTPTPLGVFYILRTTPSYGDFGPVLMATSGFSEVYQTFGPNGGDAATAIHGTNEDWSVGKAASHGCIRMHNPDAALLGRTLPEGTLVRIKR